MISLFQQYMKTRAFRDFTLIIGLLLYQVLPIYAQDYYPEDSIKALHEKVHFFEAGKQNDSVLFYNTLINQKYKWNYKKSLKNQDETLLVRYGVPYVKRLQNNLQDYRQAIKVGNHILPSAIKQRDTLALTDIYIELGQSYYAIDDYVQSILYLNEAMHILDTVTFKAKAFDVYYYIGKSTSYFDEEQAIAYLYHAEQYLPYVNDEKKYIFYSAMTAILPNFPLEHVLRYFELEKKYSHIETNEEQAIYYYNNLAYAYLENNRAQEAKTLLKENLPHCYYNKGFKGCKETIFSQYMHTVGAIERELGNYKVALECFDLSLEAAKADKDYEDVIYFSHEIAALCKRTHNYRKGFEVLEPLNAYADSLSTKDLEREVKKEQSKRLLHREKVVVEELTEENAKINITISRLTVALYVLAFAIVGAVCLNIFTKLRQIKIKEALNLNQLQNLTAAMNPHFLFNSFSTLQNLILNTNTMEANTYMANLARLIRHFFYSFEHINIPFQKEIEILESYCKLEALRQNEKFSYVITMSENLEEDDFLIPSMLIQPLVENAFKHAFTDKSKAYHLKIHFEDTTNVDYITCSITDNGIGREIAGKTKHSSNHLSISSRNLDTRLKIIQKQLKKKAEVRVIDLKNDKDEATGTKVLLVLPKIY